MTRSTICMLVFMACAGCAAEPRETAANVVVLPSSALRFAATDANERHLIVENGKECEHLADVTTHGSHAGRAALDATATGAWTGQVLSHHTPGTLIGAAVGALSGDAFGAMNGGSGTYTAIVRNCMASMGHRPIE
jgi:hypothetical protein